MAQLVDRKSIRMLSVAQRIELMDLIWETIVDDDAEVPVSKRDLAEMHRRRAELLADPSKGVSHAEMKKKLRGLK